MFLFRNKGTPFFFCFFLFLESELYTSDKEYVIIFLGHGLSSAMSSILTRCVVDWEKRYYMGLVV